MSGQDNGARERIRALTRLHAPAAEVKASQMRAIRRGKDGRTAAADTPKSRSHEPATAQEPS
jgi:hypothetical protein